MKALRTRCIAMLALAGLACGSRSNDPEGTSENASAPLTPPITSVDFENYPPGPLGATWSVSQTGARASAITIATTADHGKVLALHGSGTSGTSVSVMDAFNAGFGGDVDFDDISAKASTESTCGSL